MFAFFQGASLRIARNLIKVTGLRESLAVFQENNFASIGTAEVLKHLIAVDACNLLQTMEEDFIAKELPKDSLLEILDDYVIENLKAEPMIPCRDGADRMQQCLEIMDIVEKYQEYWVNPKTQDPGPRFYCVKDLLRRLGCESNAPIRDNLLMFVYEQHNKFIHYFRTLLEPFQEEESQSALAAATASAPEAPIPPPVIRESPGEEAGSQPDAPDPSTKTVETPLAHPKPVETQVSVPAVMGEEIKAKPIEEKPEMNLLDESQAPVISSMEKSHTAEADDRQKEVAAVTAEMNPQTSSLQNPVAAELPLQAEEKPKEEAVTVISLDEEKPKEAITLGKGGVLKWNNLSQDIFQGDDSAALPLGETKESVSSVPNTSDAPKETPHLREFPPSDQKPVLDSPSTSFSRQLEDIFLMEGPPAGVPPKNAPPKLG
ncbi:MAG TPA: hypothetical protein VMV05_02960 [bacterium]|nr:hypothetical protein [bacterium]